MTDPVHTIIVAFDAIHDAEDPVDLLTAIRNALQPDGVLLMAEPDAFQDTGEDRRAAGRFSYTQSIFYCLSVSLAQGGAGLGSIIGEQTTQELATRARFSEFRRLSVQSPMQALYELGR